MEEQRKKRNAEVNINNTKCFQKKPKKQQGNTKDGIFVTMQKEKGARGFACVHVKF